MTTCNEQPFEIHPNARQAAEPYRFRPFRRIRNLIEHLDTAYRLMDEIEAERVEAVRTCNLLAGRAK